MSYVEETIERSIAQTRECQSMLRGLIADCEMLVAEVQQLREENTVLKQKLAKKKHR